MNENKEQGISIVREGFIVRSEMRCGKWIANIALGLKNTTDEDKTVTVLCDITEKESGKRATEYKFHTFTYKNNIVEKSMLLYVEDPKMWDASEGLLYNCCVKLFDGKTQIDEASTDFGFIADK
ncbi:MAG: hypothetical protein IKH90_00410 [Ruminococcus sp.]|nr:hypothetical protein [Ruminococcus sp.]